MDSAVKAVLAIVAGAITLAIIAVVVSNQAQTPAVIKSAGDALGNVIGKAVSPVTGQNVTGTGGVTGNLANSVFSTGLGALFAT